MDGAYKDVLYPLSKRGQEGRDSGGYATWGTPARHDADPFNHECHLTREAVRSGRILCVDAVGLEVESKVNKSCQVPGTKDRRLYEAEKEEVTILQARQRRVEHERKALFAEKRDWIARVASKNRMELTFREALHAGVEIRIAGQAWHNREMRRGPGRLVFDSKDGARFVPVKVVESDG